MVFNMRQGYTNSYSRVNAVSYSTLIDAKPHNLEMEFRDWLANQLDEIGIDQTALSRLVEGLNQPTIQRVLSGGTSDPRIGTVNKIKTAVEIARKQKGLSPSSDTKSQPNNGESNTPAIPHEDDYALIPQFHVNGSCGDGYMNDHLEIRGGLAFKRDWLARMNIDPAQASVIYARGDSMAPTLNDGEVMLIDGRLVDPQSGKVYVIAVDGDLRVKRLFKRPAGWTLVSDNQDKARYPDEPLASLGDIRVLGRVVWRGGGM